MSKSLDSRKICGISHEFRFMAIQAMVRIKPTSPTRLYSTACSAAVLASARPCHHPISRNDMMPTPSQPINSWNRLLAVTRVIMATRNSKRYLKKRFKYGSACMYHDANSKIDHVTYRAMGVKIRE